MDWMDPFCREAATRGWRVFYLGSKEGVAEAGAKILRQRHPGLRMVTHHGYVDTTPGSAGSLEVLATISAAQPDVLLVGMGMPLQERWVLAHHESLEVPVVLTCGAAIEYVAGVMPTPPRWLGRLGLEWLYRLVSAPRRLWRRYLIEPWSVLGVAAKDVAHRVSGRGPYVHR
jgi:N-acetylglucosaminyldiphosphoundecaprenol N-acetyl-beta-D-mannosaminyltransferase